MKVTLDLTHLLEEKKITQEEYDRLVALSGKDTKKLAFRALITLAIIAVVSGLAGLFPEVVDALSQTIMSMMGEREFHALTVVAFMVGGFRINSSYLVILSVLDLWGLVLVLLTDHNFTTTSWWVITIAFFSVLSYGGYVLSSRLKRAQDQNLTLIISRTSLFIVNLAFMLGATMHWREPAGSMFAVLWAVGLLATGIWGAINNRIFVVNLMAVFGSILFFTQWFIYLGANPATLFMSGLIALGILYGLSLYNRRPKKTPASL